MSALVEFLGPLDVYVRQEEDCWVAAVDPFSVFGEGATRDEAVREALDELAKQLDVLAEETARHRSDGIEVQLVCPLRPEDKQGAAEKHEFFILANHLVPVASPRVEAVDRRQARRLTADRLRDLFKQEARMTVCHLEPTCG